MSIREKIEILSSVPGPSGRETKAAETVVKLLRPLVDETETDVLGNVLGIRRCGKKGAPMLLIDAHIDEVGFIVTGHHGRYLRFSPVGGIDQRILPALQVLVHTKDGPIPGVIDTLPPHILSEEEKSRPFAIESLYIDIGAADEETVRAQVPEGTVVTYSTPVFQMGDHCLCGKSLDDRSCAAIVIEALERLRGKTLGADLAVLFAVQEEVGGRGTEAAAFRISPDHALALDVTFAGTPDTPAGKTMRMGDGAAIGVSPILSRETSDRLLALAKEHGIAHQTEVMRGMTGTDADEIQVTRGGVSTALISLPLKYMHTPVEVIDLRDAEAVTKLVCLWAGSFGEVRQNA